MACWALVTATGCTIPTRTATLERDQSRVRDELAALQGKVADLEGKVAALSKRVGSVPNPKVAQRTLDQRLNPIEERLDMIEQVRDQGDERASNPAASAAPREPRPMPTAALELDLDGLRREASRQLPAGYQRGITFLRDGAYEEAIQAMREFVRAKHTSPFVAGANYWIGQSHLQLGQFYQAILAFTEVQQRFPRSEYAPAAGLASGIAFLQLGNSSEARRTFERVAADYPGSPEAAKASARLQRLDGK